MKEYLRKYGTALVLIGYLPWLVSTIIRENKWKCSIVGVCFFLLIVLSLNRKKNIDFNIVDIQAAFNKGTHRTRTDYIVIHHTAGNPNAVINDIVKVHFKERQWNGIGYHYFIAGDGTVYQLRNDNESEVPHSIGFNNTCVAICISGNFSLTECPKKQWEVALSLVREIMKKYNVPVENVKGHRELPNNPEECPGLNFNLDKFRSEL